MHTNRKNRIMFIHKSSESLNTIMSITNHTEKYLANEQRQHYEELNSPQLIISIKIEKSFQYRKCRK